MKKKKNNFFTLLMIGARESETKDINDQKKNFCRRNTRRVVCALLSLVLVILIKYGLNSDFINFISTVLSILVGLFITALIFALDKFYEPSNNDVKEYSVSMTEDEHHRDLGVVIEQINIQNSRQTLWSKKSKIYVKQFAFIVGKNIVLSIFALVLLMLNMLFQPFFQTDLYVFKLANPISVVSILLFSKLLIIVVVRLLIFYWIFSVFFNTIFVISSMVNYMITKIDK